MQAHGTLTTRHDPEWLLPHVGRLVDRHEAQRPVPWALDDAPEAYVATQLRAIVGLELVIDRLEAKAKLSQNRSAEDVEGTIEGLSAGSPRERRVAAPMAAPPGGPVWLVSVRLPRSGPNGHDGAVCWPGVARRRSGRQS